MITLRAQVLAFINKNSSCHTHVRILPRFQEKMMVQEDPIELKKMMT